MSNTAFWIYMVVMDSLIPITMLIVGRLFVKRPPRSINSAVGYRTPMSMKNQATWEFAHRYFGKVWFASGAALLPLSALALLPFHGRDVGTVGIVGSIVCAVQLAVLVAAIFPTESALKKQFDAQGNRRQ